MLRTLKVGKIHGVDALVEIINNDEILFERVKSTPNYYSEELSFNLDGGLRRINRVRDINRAYGYKAELIERSKFGIEILEKECKIKYAYGQVNKAAARHAIENAYGDVEVFSRAVKKLRLKDHKEEQTKKDIEAIIEKIKKYNAVKYLLYNVE